MIYRTIFAATILLCTATVCAQTKRGLLENSVVDNQYLYGAGRFTRTQRVLSPADPSLVGLGIKRTLLECDDAAVTDRFVTVKNWGEGTAWDAQFAEVASLTLDGMENIGPFPYADDQEIAASDWGVRVDSDGINLDGQHPVVEDVRVMRFRGVGITSRGGTAVIRKVFSERNYVGIKLASSDSSVEGSFAYSCRDACGWLVRSSGNCQSSQTHYYGGRIAFYNEGGQGFRSTNDTYADAYIGYLGADFGSGSGLAQITNANIQHNHVRGAVFRAGPVTLTGCAVNVPHRVENSRLMLATNNIIPRLPDYTGCVGLDVQAPYVTVRGGAIHMHNYHHRTSPEPVRAAEAVWLRDLNYRPAHGLGGDFCTIECPLLDADGLNGTIGIRVSGARKGIRVHCPIGVESQADAWTHANDRVLIVEDNTLRDCQFVFRGTQADLLSDPGKYVDLPAGWKPPRSNNRVTLIRSDTGEVLELVNRAY